jgi:hypothetical protein
LTFVGKNKPHSRVLSGFVVGQIKYEAKFNPVKGAIYALYDMKICLILAKRVIYDVFSIRTETVGLRDFLYNVVMVIQIGA